jgi:hypothetical protein
MHRPREISPRVPLKKRMQWPHFSRLFRELGPFQSRARASPENNSVILSEAVGKRSEPTAQSRACPEPSRRDRCTFAGATTASGNSHDALALLLLYFLQKRPTPTLTCTVFSPGFGVASPAFDICRYRTSTLQLYFAPSTCVPKAAAEVKFTVFV